MASSQAWGNLTKTHLKMAMLKARFLKQMELDASSHEVGDEEEASTHELGKEGVTRLSRGQQRWSRIRQVVISDSRICQGVTSAAAGSAGDEPSDEEQEEETKFVSAEEEDAALSNYWKLAQLPLTETIDTAGVGYSPIPIPEMPEYDQDFAVAAEQVSVSVGKVPEQVLAHEKSRLEARLFEQRELALSAIKARESDLVWREHLARQRVETLENTARRNIATEKEKSEAQFMQREKRLGRDYRRVREQLEAEAKKRSCALVEEFGHLDIGTESISRQMHLRSSSLPQPVEFRIHQLRAVKEKLPKGAYVIMLSQYSTLGGQPLFWSELTQNGIGPSYPAVTLAVKHQGRFFDKMLRFEDSVFALCPPQNSLKPGFCFVLELFLVSGRSAALDRCVAWTALPLCTEHFTVPQGKYKLPFLKGSHCPLVQNYKEMEKAMAADINNWLCNAYVEIRCFPLAEVLNTLESSAANTLRTRKLRLQYDYLNKAIRARVSCPLSDKDGVGVASGSQEAEASASETGTAAVDGGPDWTVKKELLKRSKPVPALGPTESTLDTHQSKGQVIFKSLGASRSLAELLSDKRAAEKDTRSKAEAETETETEAETGAGSALLRRRKPKSHKNWFSSLLSLVGVGGTSTAGPSSKYLSSSSRSMDASGGDMESVHEFSSEIDLIPPKEYKGTGRAKSSVNDKKQRIRNSNDEGDRGDENEDDEDDDENDEDGKVDLEEEPAVYERGYREEDELFLHPEQRGKLAGVETVDDPEDRRWATSGLEGQVVRRWQSDGVRLDSEAAEKPSEFARAVHHSNEIARSNWDILDNSRAMELFTYSIASNPSQRKRLLPGAIAGFKLRFLSFEAFGDLMPHLWGSFDTNVTLFVLLIALWLRIYLHYVGEYIYLTGYGAPVFAFQLQPLQISFKYMSSTIPQAVEIGLVAIGPITNNIIFIFFSLVGTLIFALAGFVPDGYNKFVSCFGLATLLDPLLILIVDLGYQNYNCEARSALCAANYTSAMCECFVGDFVKLYYRTSVDEGSGISGLLITLIIYAGNFIVSSFVLVEYLVHVHRNARILDIWRRISGPPEEFFLPEDFEVSHEELTSICKRSESWRGPAGSRRRVVVQNYTETDKNDASFHKTISHIAIYELTVDGLPIKLHRQFLRHDNGSIVEAFGPISLSSAATASASSASASPPVDRDAGAVVGNATASDVATSSGANDNLAGIGKVDDKLFKTQIKRIFAGLERY